MRIGAWLLAVLLGVALGTGACRKTVTNPIARSPVIHSVVAFPTVLGPGDSTMITIFASDPNGDPLIYEWHAHNGLVMKNGSTDEYNGRSPSMVFYRRATTGIDTAYVWCAVHDALWGTDSQWVRIVYEN